MLSNYGQIEQVLINLVANAVDAMPDGGTITISADIEKIGKMFILRHNFGKVGKYAVISVSDTGTGMDTITKEKIFDPFFTTKEVGKGTGLGLSIAYGIVKSHKGFIDVHSTPGKGTTFYIYLPVAESSLTGEKLHEEAGEKRATGNGLILIADDEEAIRHILKTSLERAGFEILLAIDGEDAVEKFYKNRENIALLLLDIKMPKKTGKMAYDDIIRIRQEIKTIFLSGYSEDEVIDKKMMKNKNVLFLKKPVLPSILIDKVIGLLEEN
ncbi:MAG: response regulator [Planctomycetes bacterium]|nr:response regulator [Planctomycetota bacterium]